MSAASHRATLAQKAAAAVNGEHKEASKPSTAFIPVPDAAGIVENVDQLYPSRRWVEYQSYIKFSDTVDELLLYGLNDGFTYIMDERDAEWLEKNNQEARGEGTSSQASASAAGTTTRSARSTKAKGKEADMNSPVAVNEDEFELVMGLFERITHDNTPFLHVVRTSFLLKNYAHAIARLFSSNKEAASHLSPTIRMSLRMNFRSLISLVTFILLIYLLPRLCYVRLKQSTRTGGNAR